MLDKVYSIHYTLRQNAKVETIPFGQNKRYKKCTLFSFASSNSSKFYFSFALPVRAEAHGSSL